MTPKHTVVKLLKINYKEKNLKSSQFLKKNILHAQKEKKKRES